MNTKHTPMAQPTHQPVSTNGPGPTSGAEQNAMLLSAMLDGELGEAELNDWLSCDPEMVDAATQGQSYQLIGEALRRQPPSVEAGTSASVFLAGVQTRLRSEAPAATTPAASFLPLQATRATQVRAPAANDAVFRWKLVAGLASLAGVMAVSWSVLGNAPAGMGPGAAAPQLALSQPSQEGTASVQAVADAAPAATPLAVNTSQGVLIRDAELEALMAEHRQHGGVTALQMPAGFLRNATFDPDAR